MENKLTWAQRKLEGFCPMTRFSPFLPRSTQSRRPDNNQISFKTDMFIIQRNKNAVKKDDTTKTKHLSNRSLHHDFTNHFLVISANCSNLTSTYGMDRMESNTLTFPCILGKNENTKWTTYIYILLYSGRGDALWDDHYVPLNVVPQNYLWKQ